MPIIFADRDPSPTHRITLLTKALLAALLLAVAGAHAVQVDTLYTVEVQLDPDAPDARENAYRDALREVLVRVTGSVEVAESEEMAALFPNPGRYVMQFRAGSDDSLVVRLDGPAIESLLRRSGNTVWGSERPPTVVWIAVDWGDGQREIVAADDPERYAGAARSIDRNRLLRERVEAIAAQRGVPLVFPLMDTEDRENLSFSDIWGGFDERIKSASSRYGASSILVGRVRAAAGARHRWTYLLGGQRQTWVGAPEMAINLMSDTLAAEFAFAGNAAVETISLTVAGIDSVVAYAQVEALMASLSLIDGYEIHSVNGDRIHYRVQVRGGANRLERALELSNLLSPDTRINYGVEASEIPEFNSLNFIYTANQISSIEIE